MTREETAELQRSLLALGYSLPRYGADGCMGGETISAIQEWAGCAGIILSGLDTGDIPPEVITAILAEHSELVENNPLSPSALVHDVREDSFKGNEHGRNPIERIDTICLHQMAVKDSDSIGWERWRKLAIHWVVTCGDNAAAYLLHDMDVKVWHGHGWNSRSVGFEFEGYFSGIGTEERYFWKPKSRPNRKPMVPTNKQLQAGCDAVKATVEMIERMGGSIKYIGAHRQSYGMKSSDPGELIWKGVALPMMEELGLEQAPTLGHKKYPGKPIPEAWDARNTGVKY